MSVLCEALATPHEFIHKGKTYKVSLITQEIKAAFERRLFAKAKEAARELKSLMTSEEYQAHLRKLNDEYITGDYAFVSERGLAHIKTVPGMVMLCSLLFDCEEMELIRLVNERQDDVMALIQLVIKGPFPTPEDGSE